MTMGKGNGKNNGNQATKNKVRITDQAVGSVDWGSDIGAIWVHWASKVLNGMMNFVATVLPDCSNFWRTNHRLSSNNHLVFTWATKLTQARFSATPSSIPYSLR